MSRPKEFDVDDALRRAMAAFWRKGYDSTSLQDLVAATGVQKASLYATFGDKRALFVAALRLYQEEGLRQLERDLLAGSGSPLKRIRRMLRDRAAAAAGADGRLGCLCVNACVELAPHDAGVAQHLRQHIERAEGLFEQALERARDAGELPADTEVRPLARYLYGQLLAIAVLGKTRPAAQHLREFAEHALHALPPDARSA